MAANPSAAQGPAPSGASETSAHAEAWLVSGPAAAMQIRYLVSAETTRIGRALDNEVVIHGSDATTVSLHHVVIEREWNCGRPEFRLRDLESTNGTYLNGSRVSQAGLEPPASIRLGSQGPELSFVLDEPAGLNLNQTTAIPGSIASAIVSAPCPPPAPLNTYESLLSEGVHRVRQARARGMAGQTLTIMRETVDHALRRASRRSRVVVTLLATALVFVSGFAGWRITRLNREKSAIDRHIAELESKVQTADSADQADRLITQIDAYEAEGKELQDNLFYRIGHREHDFVTEEIRRLLAEFGAEAYSVPPEFTARVKHYIEQYQGPDRPLIVRALGASSGEIGVMRDLLEKEHIPADLAYVPLVESAFQDNRSRAGAAGPWQLTPVTARASGLRIDGQVDERMNVVKSTRAASQYMRQLILDFGAGSSVMLALAAYNVGPSKVKQAISKTVQDPIKQRNFWYLYRVRALPLETREYVPKVIAVMIIARNSGRLGF